MTWAFSSKQSPTSTTPYSTGEFASSMRDVPSTLRSSSSSTPRCATNQPALRRYGQQLVRGAGLADAESDQPIDGVVFYGDVNDFKAFNTRHGHDLADLALNAVGVQLLEIARACSGRAFRRSGDEFVLLVPAAAFDHAVEELGSRMGELRGRSHRRRSDARPTADPRRAGLRACEAARSRSRHRVDG